MYELAKFYRFDNPAVQDTPENRSVFYVWAELASEVFPPMGTELKQGIKTFMIEYLDRTRIVMFTSLANNPLKFWKEISQEEAAPFFLIETE